MSQPSESPAQIPTEVLELIASVTPAKRQRDAQTLLEMMMRVTGETPVVERSAIGFGRYHYRYASGHSGDCAAAGFAPRKAAMSIYFMDGLGRHEDALAQLGPHTHAVGCLYVKDLEACDLEVLEGMLRSSYAELTATDVYTKRAQAPKN